MISNKPEWELKPLMRNGELYQLEVRFDRRKIVFRDSLKLLPGSLRSLGQSLCPEVGGKGEVDHTSVGLENLASRKTQLLA